VVLETNQAKKIRTLVTPVLNSRKVHHLAAAEWVHQTRNKTKIKKDLTSAVLAVVLLPEAAARVETMAAAVPAVALVQAVQAVNQAANPVAVDRAALAVKVVANPVRVEAKAAEAVCKHLGFVCFFHSSKE
jgi:hypothetical protein